ncbi:MAG: aldose 1-epimerase [Pseudomonadales bacterium]|nr:aldose 1-epimerase [Pseudomonadales bacterium]
MSRLPGNLSIVGTELLQLSSAHDKGTSLVTIDPCGGAAILEYSSVGNGATINWFQPAATASQSCFVMVPFCSRIASGTFSFAGRAITLPANLPGEKSAIHGHGFQREWTVDKVTSNTADLSFTHEADDWPWTYRCEQHLCLEAEKLSITLDLYNLSDTPMPYGMGLHPYFPKRQGIVLTAEVTSHLRLDDRLLPIELESLPQDLPLQDGLDLREQYLDNVFCGWQHTAQLDWPGLQQRLLLEASEGCDNLVIWVPQGESFCCIEPVSNLPDGFNNAVDFPDAFSVLHAGEGCTMSFSFTPGRTG